MSKKIHPLKLFCLITFFALYINPTKVFGEESILKKYDPTLFAKAKESGETIVLDFHAPWCPTCRKQKPVLEALLASEEFKKVVPFVVDYDNAAELKKELGVRRQSTIIVFKGNKEVGRSIGVTDSGELRDLILNGL